MKGLLLDGWRFWILLDCVALFKEISWIICVRKASSQSTTKGVQELHKSRKRKGFKFIEKKTREHLSPLIVSRRQPSSSNTQYFSFIKIYVLLFFFISLSPYLFLISLFLLAFFFLVVLFACIHRHIHRAAGHGFTWIFMGFLGS